MADRYPAEIHIGGSIKRTLLNNLVAKIMEIGASLNGYDGGYASEEEIRAVLQERIVFSLYDSHACYGHFHELEQFLICHRIHFNLHSDAYCEYDAENSYYRGNAVLTMASNQSGDPLLSVNDALHILNNAELDAHTKIRELRNLVAPPETHPLEPVRLI